MPHAVTSNRAVFRIAFLLLFTGLLGFISLPAALLKRLHLTASAATTFTVNSTGDGSDSNTGDGVCDDGSGNCTLRAAIQQANATAGSDTITFQLGSGPQTIQPATALPALDDPVVLDGATQPGYAGTPIVEIDGSLIIGDGNGLVIAGGNSTVRGLVINGFPRNGIVINVNGGNRVEGCYVGTDLTGTEARRNHSSGIDITTSNNRIGGTTPSARNVISGNDGNGIHLTRACCSSTPPGNVISGNVIGANASLTAPLPNRVDGINIDGTNNVVGGTGEGEANIIAFNGREGVTVISDNIANGNVVRGNSIFSNGVFDNPSGMTLGIDLARLLSNASSNGVTPNDPRDTDFGPNGLQNFPDITSVTPAASSFNIKGTLGSTPSTVYDLDFYASGTCDPTGFGEGVHHVGAARVTTDSHGRAAFDLTLNGALPPNQVITATATDPEGSTSEFSRCVAAGTATVGSVNFEPNSLLVSESDGVATILVTRTGGSAGTLTVGYSTHAGTALAGSDFTPTSGTLTFADGEVSKSFTVPVLDDGLDGPDVTVSVVLSTVGDLDVLGSRSFATLVIADDEPLPVVSIGDVSAAEGDSGTTAFEFTVTLSAVSQRNVNVGFFTDDGTAEGNNSLDFFWVTGGVTIPAGQTSAKITVLVRGDTDKEIDETFFVNLRDASNAEIGDGRAQGTILSDDGVPTVSISINDVTVTEGNSGTTDAVFTVSLSAASPDPVKVNLIVNNIDTTSDDLQFPFPLPPLTFAPGEVTKTINVTVKGDVFFELDETFNVLLSNPSGAFIADGTAVGTILNDDPRPTITVVSDTVVFEGDDPFGFVSLNFTVALSAPSGMPVRFRIRTIGSSATPEEDFSSIDRVETFGAGTTSFTFPVIVLGDTITESSETVFFDISEVEGASVIVSRREGTILNDDIASKPTTFQFDRRKLIVGEDVNSVAVTVTRSGDLSQEILVDYNMPAEYTIHRAEFRATASDRSDYTPTSGTLRFAPGETTKTLDVLITDDVITEPQEFMIVVLTVAGSRSFGAPAELFIYINDNDATPPASNPIDGTSFFVRQHYRDFLSRDPDAAGLAFWTNEIESCGADALCREVKRISVSQAFFFSIEFQRTGYRVFRLYRATFPDAPPRPRGMPQIREFLRDTQEVGRNVIVGQGAWEEQLQQNVVAFARRWVVRPEVLAQLPETLTAAQFVDKLFANSGVTPTTQERDAALAAFGAGGTEGRAAALLSVTDTSSVFNAQYNPAFVYMQYASYLRRHPTETPDFDFEGFDFWLSKLDSFTQPGEDAHDETVAIRRAQRAEMVKAFLSSSEYRARFGL